MDKKQKIIEKIKDTFEKKKPIIVVDDFDRENEGDFIFPAEDITPDIIAYYLKYTSGVICCAITKERADELNLDYMVKNNTDKNQTAFTVSVDYIENTTTGISSIDRSLTCKALSDDKIDKTKFTKPGHMFPLVAKPNGLKERRGHTEATIDIMKIIGKKHCGVLAEIVTDDKLDMARIPELEKIAEKEDIPILSINDIIKILYY